MNVIIVGTGYVGLVTGACFAETGNNVFCVDVNEQKITDLKAGKIPIFEPGLEDMVKRCTSNGRLYFTTNLEGVIDKADVVFSCVGTPSDVNGAADLKYVLGVARQFGRLINRPTIFVTKSTVPVGTAKKVKACIEAELRARGLGFDVYVASNPEFLKEGSAIYDFMKPDRVVIGTAEESTEKVLRQLYAPFVIDNESKIIATDIPSAEMIKYASNSMLATRISFMNEIANLCEKVGANVDNVRRGMGTDARIGNKFLYAGCGYGGSCFPKDIRALIKTGQENGCDMSILRAVDFVNERQKDVLYKKLLDYFGGDLRYKTVAVLGLAFKPNTDDVREAPSLRLIEALAKMGAYVRATDPIANTSNIIPQTEWVAYLPDYKQAINGADAVVLVTEWGDFRNIDWKAVKAQQPQLKVVIDGRNVYNRKDVESVGLDYVCIGK